MDTTESSRYSYPHGKSRCVAILLKYPKFNFHTDATTSFKQNKMKKNRKDEKRRDSGEDRIVILL